MEWFGKSWNAIICSDTNHVDTPVGQQCVRCGREILADERGLLIPHISDVPNERSVYHLHCFLKSIGVDKDSGLLI